MDTFYTKIYVITKEYLISSHYLSLTSPIIGTFTWPTPPGPYRATTCRGRELNYGSHTVHTFLTIQGNGGPPRMSDQPNAGATSDTAQTWKTIHTKHTLSHPNKANMEWWWRRPNDIRGPWGPKVSWHLSYRCGKTPKNLTQETCPDLGSNPGPLRDKRACYHVLHSSGHERISYLFIAIMNKKNSLC